MKNIEILRRAASALALTMVATLLTAGSAMANPNRPVEVPGAENRPEVSTPIGQVELPETPGNSGQGPENPQTPNPVTEDPVTENPVTETPGNSPVRLPDSDAPGNSGNAPGNSAGRPDLPPGQIVSSESKAVRGFIGGVGIPVDLPAQARADEAFGIAKKESRLDSSGTKSLRVTKVR